MKTMRISSLLIVTSLFFSILSWSQISANSAIRARVKQFETAYNAGDADAVASIYAVDGTHTYALGMTDRGRAEIAKGLRVQFTGPMKGTQIEITPLHIRSISSEIAVEEASFQADSACSRPRRCRSTPAVGWRTSMIVRKYLP